MEMNKYFDILPIYVLYSHKLSFLTKVRILVLANKHILFGLSAVYLKYQNGQG